MNNTCHQKGFTIAELLMYIVLLGVILSLGFQVYKISNHAFIKYKKYNQLLNKSAMVKRILNSELYKIHQIKTTNSKLLIFRDFKNKIHEINASGSALIINHKAVVLNPIKLLHMDFIKPDTLNSELEVRSIGYRITLGNQFDTLSIESFIKMHGLYPNVLDNKN